MLRKIVCIVILLMTTGLTALADPATQPANGDIVTRVYDISDLLWQKNDYLAPLQWDASPDQQGPQQANPSPNPTRQGPGRQYRQAAGRDRRRRISWKDNGGTIGSLRELSGQLVVTQLPENHQKIQDVLDALRAHRGRMVVVRAYWLLLEPQAVPAISSGKELPVIDDKLIDEKHLYCAGQTMCFSGQTVHVTSGAESLGRNEPDGRRRIQCGWLSAHDWKRQQRRCSTGDAAPGAGRSGRALCFGFAQVM